ncbi:MAG: hypothetical protein JHC61_12475 [Burkholderiaceae bacterium]|nr:hypothetical protein [Burkholderiaceae bacterium]
MTKTMRFILPPLVHKPTIRRKQLAMCCLDGGQILNLTQVATVGIIGTVQVPFTEAISQYFGSSMIQRLL